MFWNCCVTCNVVISRHSAEFFLSEIFIKLKGKFFYRLSIGSGSSKLEMAANFRTTPIETMGRVCQPPLNANAFEKCLEGKGLDINEEGLPAWVSRGDIFVNVARKADRVREWDRLLLESVPPRFKPLAAAFLIKCFDSLGLPTGTVLPRSIYEVARPIFLSHWEFWSQRLSVPTTLAALYPRAIKGETLFDWPRQRLQLQDTKRSEYFLDDILLDEYWRTSDWY